MRKKCIVKGCVNHIHQGGFIGDMCVPCYEMITTGKISYGKTFIHDLRDKIVKYEKLIESLTNLIESLTNIIKYFTKILEKYVK